MKLRYVVLVTAVAALAAACADSPTASKSTNRAPTRMLMEETTDTTGRGGTMGSGH